MLNTLVEAARRYRETFDVLTAANTEHHDNPGPDKCATAQAVDVATEDFRSAAKVLARLASDVFAPQLAEGYVTTREGEYDENGCYEIYNAMEHSVAVWPGEGTAPSVGIEVDQRTGGGWNADFDLTPSQAIDLGRELIEMGQRAQERAAALASAAEGVEGS